MINLSETRMCKETLIAQGILDRNEMSNTTNDHVITNREVAKYLMDKIDKLIRNNLNLFQTSREKFEAIDFIIECLRNEEFAKEPMTMETVEKFTLSSIDGKLI